MNDTSDTLPKRRRRSRKAADPAAAPAPAVQAILDQALQAPEAGLDGEGGTDAPAPGRRAPRKRRRAAATKAEVAVAPAIEPLVEPPVEPTAAPETTASVPDDDATAAPADDRADTEVETSRDEGGDHGSGQDEPHPADATHAPGAHAPPPGDDDHRSVAAAPPAPPHHWVYLAVAVFLLALGFGLWGVWATFFASAEDHRSAAALRAGNEKLSQEVTILRRSDQISRDANRDLERTLAERDEEIAGLRADIAFYERFVGATGQRRGLSVHDLEVRPQSGEVWHFVATLTQNVNRGAVNSGRVTLSVEGTRNDRLERLSWSALRKQSNAPGQPYSFKYFQQVEGEVMLPQGFKPLRVTVRLVPQGGSAVEQSFPWPDAVRSAAAGG
jgi:hypothetical protein